MFDLILYVPVNIFQLCRDGSTRVEPVLSKDKCVLLKNTSDSFTILGLWVLGLAVSNINESPLQTNESKTLFLMTSLTYCCIPGLAEIKTYAQKMQDAQVTKSLEHTVMTRTPRQ